MIFLIRKKKIICYAKILEYYIIFFFKQKQIRMMIYLFFLWLIFFLIKNQCYRFRIKFIICTLGVKVKIDGLV